MYAYVCIDFDSRVRSFKGMQWGYPPPHCISALSHPPTNHCVQGLSWRGGVKVIGPMEWPRAAVSTTGGELSRGASMVLGDSSAHACSPSRRSSIGLPETADVIALRQTYTAHLRFDSPFSW